MAAEVTEAELATGDAPVVAEAGDGFVSEENVVITQRAAHQRIGRPLKVRPSRSGAV